MGAQGRTGRSPGVTAHVEVARSSPVRTGRNEAHDLTERPDFWVLLLRARAVATVLLPLALVAFPVFGPDRFVLACAVGVVGTSINLALLQRVRGGHPIGGMLACFDVASVLLVVAFAPATYAAGTILLVSIGALYLFWFGGRYGVRLLAPMGLGLLAIGLWRSPEMWVPTWLAWLTTSAVGGFPVSRMAALSISIRNRYDHMVNGIDAAVWESSGDSRDATFMSERLTQLLGFEPDELCTFEALLDRVVPEDRARVVESRERAERGQDVEVHYDLIDAGGERRHMHERIRVTQDPETRERHRRGILVDESARWNAERSVRAYADFVEGLPIALAILHLDEVSNPSSLRVVVGNPTAAALVGLEPDQVVGKRLRDLLPLSTIFMEALADVALHDEILERPYVRLDHLDSVYAMRAVPLPDHCVGLMLEDVTDRANRSRSLQHQATHDHLTGLPNRARFNDRLSRAMERAQIDGRSIGVLMVDLNQFKEVNDTLGHETGDLLLIELARRFSAKLRYCDTIARLGGDEFAILLTDSVDHASAAGAAQRVVELCEEPFDINGFRLQVGASVGIACSPEHGDEAGTLLRHADHAMYRAKESGGGAVMYSPIKDASGVTRISLLEDLRSAVGTDEVLVHYQPRVDLRTGRPVGVEALVRWKHPRRGLLDPAEFLELAEVSGEIEALTRTVATRATQDLARVGLSSSLTLNVNVSTRSFRNPEFLEWVRGLVVDGGIAPGSLCFEIDECQLMEDTASTGSMLRSLKALGIRVSMDDFGTADSSIARLRELPLDEVKIDSSLVATLERDPTVVRSMIELCHNLGLHVVAEGVESQRVLDLLAQLGCDSAQGYHLGSPMDIDALVQYLAADVLRPSRQEHRSELRAG